MGNDDFRIEIVPDNCPGFNVQILFIKSRNLSPADFKYFTVFAEIWKSQTKADAMAAMTMGPLTSLNRFTIIITMIIQVLTEVWQLWTVSAATVEELPAAPRRPVS